MAKGHVCVHSIVGGFHIASLVKHILSLHVVDSQGSERLADKNQLEYHRVHGTICH
jgi:hypothetical protein